jgi:cell division protein FtsN
MKNNERGGIISNLFIIPAGIALMIGVFLLGYYVGRYQGKANSTAENPSPLPEVVAEKLPKPEDFTFYKTLTEKENKTVSIDLKPKSSPEENKPDQKQALAEPKESADKTKNKKVEVKIEKKPSDADAAKKAASKPVQAREKKDSEAKKPPASKLRYTVQVASYPDKQLADDEAKKMRSRGYAAFVVSSDVPGKGTWFRVRLGSFTSKASAERLAKEIHTKVGVSSIITLE